MNTNNSSIENLLRYGVPEFLVDHFKSLNYRTLTRLQISSLDNLFNSDKNIIVSAPTNTGKTFICELAALNLALSTDSRRSYFLFPLKSLAEEKFISFGKKYGSLGLEVAISTGDHYEFDAYLTEYKVILVTYEKLLSLIVKGQDNVENIGLVVIDELQTLGDFNRGANLEILITLLLNKQIKKPRIIGLSATLNDESGDLLCDWLDATLIETDYREIELREGIIYTGESPLEFLDHQIERGDFIYKNFNSGKIEIEKELFYYDQNLIAEKSKEESFLLFYNTRTRTESEIRSMSPLRETGNEVSKLIIEREKSIESNPTFIKLKRYLLRGIGFYHAGMVSEERNLVITAYNTDLIGILSTTSGLGAGVNTPTQNVIFFDVHYYDKSPFSIFEYKNMSGRAGRIGFSHPFGRSILIANNIIEMHRLWNNYIIAEPGKTNSQLGERRNLPIYVLKLLTTKICENEENLLNFIFKTYFGKSYLQDFDTLQYQEFKDTFYDGIQRFKDEGFIYEEENELNATELGKIVAREGISVIGAKQIYDSLNLLESLPWKDLGFTDLIPSLIHLACSVWDAFHGWMLVYYNEYYDSKPINIFYTNVQNILLNTPTESSHHFRALKTTLTMLDWIDGVSFTKLWKKYHVHHGTIRNSASGISWLLENVCLIAKNCFLDFPSNLLSELETLKERLIFGTHSDLLDVMKLDIPPIHRNIAYNMRLKKLNKLENIFNATPDDLMEVDEIDRDMALLIFNSIEEKIKNKHKRILNSQIWRIKNLGRDTSFIELLFKKTGIEFEKICMAIFSDIFGFVCTHHGDTSIHGCDFLLEYENDIYAFECKRKNPKKLVSATEAEEIIGKSSNLNVDYLITIGFPDFSQTAKKNCSSAGITLIRAEILGEIMIEYWRENLNQESIISLLKKRINLNIADVLIEG